MFSVCSMNDVRDFGAKGDGRVDDSAAIQHALDNTTATIFFPAGIYKVTKQLNVPRNVDVVGAGTHASVVTAEGASPSGFARAVFGFHGAGFVRLPPLKHDLAKFTDRMMFQKPVDLKSGDSLVVIDPRPFSYSRYRPYYNAGEFVRVNHAHGSEVQVVGGFYSDYSRNGVEVYLMRDPTRSSLRGLTVVGTGLANDDNTYCLSFKYGVDVSIQDVCLRAAHYSLCTFQQCFGVMVRNVEGYQLFAQASASGGNYGIAIGNSQDVRISDCRLTAMRHAVAIGGDSYRPSQPNPVNRRISVSSCDLKTTTAENPLDAHGNTEYYTFEKNRIWGGIDFGGAYGRMIGNELFGRDQTQASVAFYATEWKSTEHEIRNNRIHTIVTEFSSRTGIIYLYTTDWTEIGGPTIIADNLISISGSSHPPKGIGATAGCSRSDWILIVDNNDFHSDVTGRHIDCRVGNVLQVLKRKMVSTGIRAAPFLAVVMRNNTLRNGQGHFEEGCATDVVVQGNWPQPEFP